MAKRLIYLDYAAATPVDRRVLAAMRPYFSDRFYNPSASYQLAQAVAKDLARARATIAHWLGAKAHEIIFTAGGTEANNLGITGVMRRFPGANVVVSAIEHESVLAPAQQFPYKLAPVDTGGLVDLVKLKELVNDKTVLISISLANNEVGAIQPLRKIASLIKSIKKDRLENGNNLPLYLHSDASQAAEYLDLHVHRLGVDLLTLNGGKIYGPKQSGALFVASNVTLQPLILGGGQETGQRSGTENVVGAVGLATALALAQTRRAQETKRVNQLSHLFQKLLRTHLPAAHLNGSLKHHLPNNIHFTIPGQSNERLLLQLETKGVIASAGSACGAANTTPSRVLQAIGLSDRAAQASIRLSLGRGTTSSDIHSVIKVLKRCTTS